MLLWLRIDIAWIRARTSKDAVSHPTLGCGRRTFRSRSGISHNRRRLGARGPRRAVCRRGPSRPLAVMRPVRSGRRAGFLPRRRVPFWTAPCRTRSSLAWRVVFGAAVAGGRRPPWPMQTRVHPSACSTLAATSPEPLSCARRGAATPAMTGAGKPASSSRGLLG
jgi:hypothetical protein